MAAALALAASTPAPRDSSTAAGTLAWSKQRVTFMSGELTLEGFLFKPTGRGPFPLLIWNHGSEPDPAGGPQFDSVAAIFAPAGYVVFAPVRRGQSGSQGRYIQDEIALARETGGMPEAQRTMIRLHETEQLDDQLAGQAFAKRLPGVDSTRMVVAGCSYGGIQTLLAAERGAGYKAAFAISPAALSWNGNTLLQEWLVHAVAKIEIPVFLIQPPKDASLEPSRVLGAEFKRLRKRFTGKIYPAEGPADQQRHCFGGAKGMHIWAKDALEFFAGAQR